MSNTSIYSKLTEKELLSSIPAEANLFAEVNGETKRVPGYVMDIYATKEELANIPTPDVSGQIASHSEDAEAHADIRADLENHTHSWEDLNDKPFGEEVVEIIYAPEQTVVFRYDGGLAEGYVNIAMDSRPQDGDSVVMYFDGEEVFSTDNYDDFATYSLSYQGRNFQANGGISNWTYWGDSLYGNHTVRIVGVQKEIKTLDEKFIPESIARTDYVDSLRNILGSHTHFWDELADKPFGEEFGEKVFVLDEVNTGDYTLSKYTEGNISKKYYYISGNPFSAFVVGETYTVMFDGEKYECECKDEYVTVNHYTYLTDGSELWSIRDAGAKFLICYDEMDSSGGYIFVSDTSVAHTIEVYQQNVTTKLIDEKFIPETISRTDHVHSWNELKDRPFSEKRRVEYSGDYDASAEVVTDHAGWTWRRVDVMDYSDLCFGEVIVTVKDVDIYEESTTTMEEVNGSLYVHESGMFFVTFGGVEYRGTVFDAGAWIKYSNEDYYVTKIETPSIKRLAERFIDGAIARTSDVDAKVRTKADVEHKHYWNDLNDKPFGVSEKQYIVNQLTFTNGDCLYVDDGFDMWILPFETATDCTVIYDGVMYAATVERSHNSTNYNPLLRVDFTTQNGDDISLNFNDGENVFLLDEDEHTIDIYLGGELKTLDEDFIPSTIARKTDIPEIPEQVQPDWNAPEGAPGHVLNRTHWVENTKEPDTLVYSNDALASGNTESGSSVGGDSLFSLTDTNEYMAVVDGVEYRATVTEEIVGGGMGTVYRVNFTEAGIEFIDATEDGYMSTNFMSCIVNSGAVRSVALYIPGDVNTTYQPLSPSLGGMPTLASDGSDAGKTVKVNENGTGYELGAVSGGPELIFDGDITFDIENNDGQKCYKSSNAVEIPIEFGAVYIIVSNYCYEVNGEIAQAKDYGSSICVGSNNGYDSPGIGAGTYQDTGANAPFHFSVNEAYYYDSATMHFKIYKWL